MSFQANLGAVEDMAGETSLDIVHSDFVRRFDNESGWKGDLESKASTMLGIVGVLIALLFSTDLLWSDKIQDTLVLIGVPMSLQILAAFILFFIISGYATAIGPAFTEVFGDMKKKPEVLRRELLISYAACTLQNRILFSRRVLYFQTAVLLVAASYLLLALNLVAVAPGWSDRTGSISVADAFPLIAAFTVIVILLVIAFLVMLIQDYLLQAKRQEEDLRAFEDKSKLRPDVIMKIVGEEKQVSETETRLGIEYMTKSEERLPDRVRDIRKKQEK